MLLQAKLKERNIVLLSENFTHREDKVEALCLKCGNEWPTTAIVLQRGHGCPACAGNKRLTAEMMNEFVVAKHGPGSRCLASSIKNAHQIIRWRCLEGHIFPMNSNNVRSGGWCRKCGIKRRTASFKNRLKTDPHFATRMAARGAKPVTATAVDGSGEIRHYASAVDAKKDGFSSQCISSAIKEQTPYKGYFWQFDKKR
jgi:predicted  nucleic acid-binding Zn-ribbon protein